MMQIRQQDHNSTAKSPVVNTPAFRILFTLLLLIVYRGTGFAGQDNIEKIEQLIKENKNKEAQELWDKEVAELERSTQFDSLYHYILPLGRIQLASNSGKEGKKKLLTFVDKIIANTTAPQTIAYTYSYLAKYYEWIAEWENSYDAYLRADSYVKQITKPEIDWEWQCTMQNNLSIVASQLNRIQDSKKHLDSAVMILNRHHSIEPDTRFRVYNSIGAKYYYTSQFDSSLYYFNKAYETCKSLENSNRNRLYLPAMVLNNMSGIYPEIGKISKAIETQKEAIDLTNQYINETTDTEYKGSARNFLCQQIDNLAGLNKRIGNFKEAERLLLYAYQLKKESGSPSQPELAISEILLGQVYYDLFDYNNSERFLENGLQKISGNEKSYSMWKASAYHFLALIAEKKKNTAFTDSLFKQATGLYKSTFGGYYDESFLDFSTDLSRFYARTNRVPEAISIAEQAYRYVLKYQNEQYLSPIRHSFNLAAIHLLGKEYETAIRYANQGIQAAEKLKKRNQNLLDSVMAVTEVPHGTLIKTKAEYGLIRKKSKETIQPLIDALENVLETVEFQKAVTVDKEDTRMIVTNNKSVNDFLKQLYLDLYESTKKKEIVDKVLRHHEATLYSKIRNRLNSQDLTVFKGVPVYLTEREKELENLLKKSILAVGRESSGSYFSLMEEQARLKKEIQLKYPDYYNIRYGTGNDALESVQKRLPAETTVIRYFYSGENTLGAIVFDRERAHLKILGNPPEDSGMQLLLDPSATIQDLSRTLHELYRKLWLPLQPLISHKKVIIIPDGPLFNLSFELLTPEQITDYKQLAEVSLLNRHLISYHYSALSLGKRHSIPDRQNSEQFVAFIPGFTNKMKEDYAGKVMDPLYLDKTYLTLLPQPFSLRQAEKTASLFRSSVFVEEACTIENFKQLAGDHAIIHLGTHGETSNLSAEFSKLIFAKDRNDYLRPNILYLSDIYGCNLTSDLTVITACETGVHTYSDGEGMISMGHAFQYAGSNSILTSLSKIDEQTSNIIIGYFYEYLARGLAKDEALQQAKLDYLNFHSGRLLQPHYWASLIIMGDTARLSLQKNNSRKKSLYLLLSVALLGTLYFLFKSARKDNS